MLSWLHATWNLVWLAAGHTNDFCRVQATLSFFARCKHNRPFFLPAANDTIIVFGLLHSTPLGFS